MIVSNADRICAKCQFHRNSQVVINGHECVRDSMKVIRIDLVTGARLGREPYDCYDERVATMRADHEPCGPEGRFFVRTSLKLF